MGARRPGCQPPGALIAGAGAEDCRNLYEYGFNIGLAFQVADDWLDAFGDAKVFGKPIGGDIVNSKKSWLTVRAFEKADDSTRKKLTAAMSMHADTEEEKKEKIAGVMAIYRALDVDSDARKEIEALTRKALSCAAKAVSGEKLETLEHFANRLVGRTK